MHHTITVNINTAHPSLAEKVRDEISGAVEDFIDSCHPEYGIFVEDVRQVSAPTPNELAVIEAARTLHKHNDDMEIYDAAIVSSGEDGYWVQASVWVPIDEVVQLAPEVLPEPPKMGYSAFKLHYIEGQTRSGQKWTMGSLRNAWLAYKDGA